MEEVKIYTIIDVDEEEIVPRFSTNPKEVWGYMHEIESDTWGERMVVVELSIPYDLIGELFDKVYHRETDIDYVVDLIMPRSKYSNYNWKDFVWTPEGGA
jgi:hypothetical protein